MSIKGCFSTAILFIYLFTTSCEKAELPIELPPKGTAVLANVNMGEEYEDQIFFDLESGQSVMVSQVNSWDLAFETGAEGYHIFINGGKNVFVYNTHKTNVTEVIASYQYSIKETELQADAPCGLPDSTAIGEWKNVYGDSKNEIYVVKLNNNSYKKIIIRSVNEMQYELSYGDISSNSLSNIIIPKNTAYNYTYFSFDNNGSIVTPEPPKADWDIVFTRYRYIYNELNNFPYLVSGVLLNPYNTSAAKDSINSFENITVNTITNASYSNHRDVIGYDWKLYNFTTERYEINAAKNYIIKTRKNQYWKIHFLDFYNSSGVKGSPSFEFERLE